MSLFKNGELHIDTKNKLIAKYPVLNDEDFGYRDKEKLLNHLQQKLGKTKKEIHQIIEQFSEYKRDT